MTQKALKRLRSLRNATKRYSPQVEQKLSRHGKKADSAVVSSAAKYYIALKKLAEK
jgi:hypothetical protein